MSTELAGFYSTWKSDRGRMNRESPEMGRGFATFYQSVMKDGALALRDKELIALAISVALRCTPCIYLHARGAVKAGASRAQVLDAAAVAAMMQGGPSFVYVREVIKVLDHLEAQ